MINLKKQDPVADAVKNILQQEEKKRLILEPEIDETGFHKAAHAAKKANQNTFEFQGKKYPVTAKSHAEAIQQEEGDCVTKPEVKNIAKKEVKGHEKSMHHKEEIDVNDRTKDMIGGRAKTKQKDDVGPSGDSKSTKVRFHAGPKNEAYAAEDEKKLADDMSVTPAYRGQGIAKKVYDHMKSLGYNINRSQHQTDAGAHFWDKNKGKGSKVWEQGVAEADKHYSNTKNPVDFPKTWHDVDKKLGKAVDKMSQAEKVKKGLAHPDTLKKKGVAEAAKWRDPKYKDKLYTQEPPDYMDTREYDNAMWNPKPDNYPGRKELAGGGEFPDTDPLVKGYGRSGIKHNILDRGKRKGLPSRDQISSLKQSIRDVHGKHTRANLPEQGVAEANAAPGSKGYRVTWTEAGQKSTTGLLMKPDALTIAKKLQTKPGASDVKVVPYRDVSEGRRPDSDSVPFVTDEAKPMVHAKDLAKKSFKRMKSEMLGKISN